MSFVFVGDKNRLVVQMEGHFALADDDHHLVWNCTDREEIKVTVGNILYVGERAVDPRFTIPKLALDGADAVDLEEALCGQNFIVVINLLVVRKVFTLEGSVVRSTSVSEPLFGLRAFG